MSEGSPSPNSVQGRKLWVPHVGSWAVFPGTGDLVHERGSPNTDEVFKPNMPGAVQMSSQISGQEKCLKYSTKKNTCFISHSHYAMGQFSKLHYSDDLEGRLFTIHLSFLEKTQYSGS